MELSDKQIKDIQKRIVISRMRILSRNGFYGILLMNMKIALSTKFETAWTDCKEHIWFNPEFVAELSDKELDFVFMHEVVHVILRHTYRMGDRDPELYNIATDIVVNSNILHSNDDDVSAITLDKYGISEHLAPDGTEGYTHTAEEVYRMLVTYCTKDYGPNGDEEDDDIDANGKGKETNSSGKKKGKVPCKRLYGNAWRDASDDEDSYKEGWDIHEFSEMSPQEADLYRLKWEALLRKAYESISIREKNGNCDGIPAFAKRLIDDLRAPQIDWRQLLVEFIQDEINDYSFMPPDKRMSEGPYFLPDFNESVESVKKILYMVDTSGSMSDKAITDCYAEIKGAIEQFDGRMEGYVGFFDASVTEPVPFESVDDLLSIKPIGGGGTNFHSIFAYVNENMSDDYPESIVILTDGYAQFPDESVANGIPVIWVINNEDQTPPWGVVARIS